MGIGRRRLTRTAIEASALLLITGIAAGCGEFPLPGSFPTATPTSTSSVPASTASASGTPAPTAPGTSPTATTTESPTAQPTATSSASVPTQTATPPTQTATPAPSTSATTTPTPTPTAPTPTPPMPTPTPTPGPTAPTPTPTTSTSAPAPPGAAVFTANCPEHGSTSAPGCGSWDAGPLSGQAPGFAAGQQSAPNLLGVNQDPWTGSQGPQVLTARSFQDWSVTATDTDPSNAPGMVLTYPDASYNYYQLGTHGSVWFHRSSRAVRPDQHHVADQ
jgi:hypothetical protein